ncbi:hypothetical protein [Sediminibacterium sp.]|uniref:hypothetical protein n=1 Tax=Sediminibacterium sp. TaxID=1917865 RepID=UPI002735A0CC|nr:hypothetical protein [Sediminibacterium sp.]MDP3393004.1 hypothetical protein [Sediminibacterium sp.]MDP3567210.1 hypothetical protein [Sediminibacterium sp.]
MNQKIVYLIVISMLLACNKNESSKQTDSFSNAEFFLNKLDAKQQLTKILNKRNPTEKIRDIQTISYIKSDSSTLAIIFYTTNTGNHNILLEKKPSTQLIDQYSITFCEGYECTCKVTVLIDNQGKVTTNCSCVYCALVTTQ